MSGSHLLITGGAGFLGHYLVQAVLHRNRDVTTGRRIRVTVYDNYIRGVPAWLQAAAQDPSLEVVQHDITRELPAGAAAADFIVHAASIASPTFYRQHPIETMDANIHGLRRLLDHAAARPADRRVRGFLFYSSSEIYGDPPADRIPTDETFRGLVSCTGPRACYDESKRFGETLCWNFARQHGLPITTARPFNNYGPGLDIADRRVLPDLASCVLQGRDVVLYSDGTATRTFCYVADAVIGYYKVLVRGRAGEAYNIGTEQPEITMRELAELVIAQARELFGYAGRLAFEVSGDPQYLVDNPTRRCPSIAKARAELGYEPRVTLAEGVRRSLLWYAAHAK
ncbi:MAG: NAD-dependent epimerase/dehydratase family protein [Acidobacteria bacterium]|nr:NAD-dependent epimerase/dehydratase family protein [Acidobacteriota bacterium]